MDIEFGKSGRSFLAWWAGELAALLPGPVRTALLGGGARLEVLVDDDHLVLDLLGPGTGRRTATLPRLPDPSRDRSAGRTIRSFVGAADEIVLRLSSEHVLRTVFDLPLSAGTALDEALTGEIARRTPFRIGEIQWDWRVRASDMELERLYVEVLIAQRRDLSDVLTAVNSVGISPERIEGPRQDDGGEKPFNLIPDDAQESRRPRRGRLVRRLAFAVLALAVAWGAVALERRKMDLEVLEERLGALRAENEAVSAMEARFDELVEIRSFLAEKKQAAVPVIAVLADVTRRLPDGDWVYGYSAAVDSISLQGLSRDASRLPELLERSDYLGDVAFIAPVRRSMQDELDDFTITAVIEGPR